MSNIVEKAKQIKLLITDVDGVLTHGQLFVDMHGSELKAFHVQDGLGLILLMMSGLEVAVITGSNTPIIQHRMAGLGIPYVYQNCLYKLRAYKELKAKLNLQDREIACIGDDVPDLPLLQQCGLSVAVPNAVNLVQEQADYITTQPGGHGAVRELCDLIMTAQQTLHSTIEKFFDYHAA